MELKESEICFASGSVVDNVGKVFFYDSNVYRAIYCESIAKEYRKLLAEDWFTDVFRAGLVDTEVSDVHLENAFLTLKHKKLSFFTHPVESTARQHWESALTLVRVNKELVKHGYVTKDSHPWNFMMDKGEPKFIDFGSIIPMDTIPNHWLNEFRRYFAVPLWLASRGWFDLALEYRRQHVFGFGIKLFDNEVIKKTLLYSLMKIDVFSQRPERFFAKLEQWICCHSPKKIKGGKWSSYAQYTVSSNPLAPVLPKQCFVYSVLEKERPSTVLDCAANKGYYSEMAARLGASVVSFDYEESCVNECNDLAKNSCLDITPVLMDFSYPTPPFAMGLIFGSSYQRFKSDIVIAIGLVHHICIIQELPVRVFCKICIEYAINGLIFEYIDPADCHVKSWNKPTPCGYSLEEFIKLFSDKFLYSFSSQWIENEGTKRKIIYFSNTPYTQ